MSVLAKRRADYNEGHPATLPIADYLPLPKPTPFQDPVYFTRAPDLNDNEIAHFKRDGFIVKRGLIDDPALFAEVVDLIWSKVPRELMRRHDSETWVSPADSEWTEADSLKVGMLARDNWKIRSKGPSGIGTEALLVDGIANHPKVQSVVGRLIGRPVKPVRRVRGVYCIFPSAPGTANRYNVHVDYISSHVAAMVMVDEIGPDCGGFMFWPGSHVTLHPYWQTVHGSGMDAAQAEPFRAAKERILKETSSIEFTGSPGDVIFWHPRALHSAGINRSAEKGKPMARPIVPCDFQLAGLTFADDTDFGPGEDFQWWIDTRNTTKDLPTTTDNIWDDWAI